jgi:hypothetical protein
VQGVRTGRPFETSSLESSARCAQGSKPFECQSSGEIAVKFLWRKDFDLFKGRMDEIHSGGASYIHNHQIVRSCMGVKS